MKTSFPFHRQLDAMDCGLACLRMVAQYYGRHYSSQSIRQQSGLSREGVSLLGISRVAEDLGLHSIGVKLDPDTLLREAPLPAILHWRQNHFVVLHRTDSKGIHLADPAHGKVTLGREEFEAAWLSDVEGEIGQGVALLLEPTPDFYAFDGEKEDRGQLTFFLKYLRRYRAYVWQLMLGLLLGALLQLIFPFLTQAVVDFGIGTRNVGFIYLMLLAQLLLFVGRLSVELIRRWILLHISTRFNIAFISDFLLKLMKLPLGFFDSKMIGDLIQRIGDHHRIERFLTQSGLNTLFSLVSILITSTVLGYYSGVILGGFLLGTCFYVGWIMLFLKRRRKLDYQAFAKQSANQSKIIQLIEGIHEIKLNNIEQPQRWEWEGIQAGLFQVQIRSLTVEQVQQVGSAFFREITNILITIYVALQVIEGQMTLGMMLAISYLLGQLNGPVGQLIGFIQDYQDAQISLERLGEIHQQRDEEGQRQQLMTELPESHDLRLEKVNFRYGGPESPQVLRAIDLIIPEGKTTAIVGSSGSGKTTLVKLLLKFYEPTEGGIFVSRTPLSQLRNDAWRAQCGVVMQDGYIFSDTIAFNIALEAHPDRAKLLRAVQVANIQGYIEALPLGYSTKIGREGVGLSAGQRQRLLIARAVYKDPAFLFFDEATNALDANNELTIMRNLEDFLRQRTVVVVAHRLSTVKHADQIIVLEEGQIIEQGKHAQLVEQQGAYFQLVSNQLELS